MLTYWKQRGLTQHLPIRGFGVVNFDMGSILDKLSGPGHQSEEDDRDKFFREHQELGPGPVAQETALAARKCEKNPGHDNFISVQKLTIKHLPKEHQNDWNLLEYIKVVADLTVRLRVRGTSSNRPVDGYYGSIGGPVHTGTGFIWDVKFNNEHKAKPLRRQRKKRKSWRFMVETARHVVFDESEAGMTRIDLFYDSEESRIDGSMKTVKGRAELVCTSEAKTDWCWLKFTTRDLELGKKLEELDRRRTRLERRMIERYGSEKSSNLVWIVSHPHGIAKLISFGEMKDKEELKSGYQYKYSYSAQTCPGSSGARVCGLGGSGLIQLSSSYSTPHHCKGGGKLGWNEGFTY